MTTTTNPSEAAPALLVDHIGRRRILDPEQLEKHAHLVLAITEAGLSYGLDEAERIVATALEPLRRRAAAERGEQRAEIASCWPKLGDHHDVLVRDGRTIVTAEEYEVDLRALHARVTEHYPKTAKVTVSARRSTHFPGTTVRIELDAGVDE